MLDTSKRKSQTIHVKTCKVSPALLLLVSVFPAAFAGQKISTFRDIPTVPSNVLERTIGATLHKELLVSPVEGWIAVRGQLSETHIYGARVVHYELGGAYDKYADGTMALSFPYFDGPSGNQFEYYGATKLAVQESDGWRELKLPKGPKGDLWTVRDGIANRYDLAMKLNQIKVSKIPSPNLPFSLTTAQINPLRKA